MLKVRCFAGDQQTRAPLGFSQAAQCWQGAYYLGFDQDRKQLDRANHGGSPVVTNGYFNTSVMVVHDDWMISGSHRLETSILRSELLILGESWIINSSCHHHKSRIH